MADCLAKAGLYLDEFNRLRILEPAVFHHANELKDGCKTYDENVSNIQNTVDSFITTLSNLGEHVEKERMIAIGLRNSLKSVMQDKERHHQKLQALIMEKTMELERLQLEYHSLQLIEVEQQELVEYLTELN